MYNESVKNYLKDNREILKDYYKECYDEVKEPNYSELCRKYLSGTTAEGIAFDSSKLIRADLTSYLREGYRLWVLT